jgi:hypothetical protein
MRERLSCARQAPVTAAAAGLGVAAVLCALSASAATAQTVLRGQGVAERPRPDYDPLGIDVGAFQLYPQINLDARATDNFRAANVNRQSDVYMLAVADLRFNSTWAQNEVAGGAYVSQSAHALLPAENVTQYGASLRGALDVSRESQLRASINADHKVESRTSLGSFQGTPTPVSYDIYLASVGGSQIIDRLVVNATLAFEQQNFFDAIASDGSVIDQSYRDVRTIRAGGSAQYEVRSGVSLLVSGMYVNADYTAPLTSPTELRRNSAGFDLLGGVSLELSSLIFGQVQFGYLSRIYVDPRLKDINGPSFQAALLWNVTPLTSLRLGGARTIEDASSTQFAGNTRSEVNFSVQHELYRYIILSADIAVSHFSPNGPGASGNEFGAGIGGQYLIDRNWRIGGTLRYAQRTSEQSSLEFHATTVSILTQLTF